MNIRLKLLRGKLQPLVLGLFITMSIVFCVLLRVPYVNSTITLIDNQIYDVMSSLFLRKAPSQVRVVVIDIDETSIQNEGRWPWPRDKFALLIKQLKKAGVVVTCLDIVMTDPEINYALGLKEKLQQLEHKKTEPDPTLMEKLTNLAPIVDNDNYLAKTLSTSDVILGTLFHHEHEVKRGQLPPPLMDKQGHRYNANQYTAHRYRGYDGSFPKFMHAAKHGGFVSNLPDSDGVIRYGLSIAAYGDYLYPSLALATAMRYLLIENVDIKSTKHHGKEQIYGLQLDDIFIPLDESGQLYIPFWGHPHTLDYYSASDIMEGKVDKKELEGAIAIVGSSTILFADLHPSPVANLFPGVEMVGNIVAGIIEKSIIAPYLWSKPSGLVIMAAFGIFFSLLLPFLSIPTLIVMLIIVPVIMFISSLLLFVYSSLYVPIGFLLVLILLIGIVNYSHEFISVKRQKSRINQLFGQYVPQEYVQNLLDSPESYTMEGQTRVMTALFTDIRNFSGLSESLNASEVKRLLNTFFTPITEIIFNHHGTIDKYVGDMVVAFWGAPIDDAQHATHAIAASMEIFEKLPEINRLMVENGLPAVNIGIGLSTGEMNVGDMGSKFRRAYTVIGDTVNLASRLQDLTKYYHANILVNDHTREGQDDFIWRMVDKVSVKGRHQTTLIYEPLCRISEASPELIEDLAEYHQAIDDYYHKNFSETKRRLEALQKKNPNVYWYTLFLERIAEFEQTPPPDDWNGVYVHLHK